MGSAASKGARRLPKTAPTAAHPTPAAPRPPPEAFAEAAREQPPAPQQQQSQPQAQRPPPAGREFNYSIGRERAGDAAPFSGEKDENVIRDAMDPQFLANLQQMGQVNVAGPEQYSRGRTLTARRREYTNPSAIPPAGTTTMGGMTQLLDMLKTLPEGTDPEPWYRSLGLRSEDMAVVRRWVNSPSVTGEETVHIKDGMNQTVEQQLEMKSVWVEAKDKGARKI